MRKHSYTVLLAASFAVLLVFWMGGYLSLAEYMMSSSALHPEVAVETQDAGQTQTTQEAEEPSDKQDDIGTPVFHEADVSYWDDALFIGDSRTVGLFEYGDLGGAAVFAETGMSTFKLFDMELTDAEGEKVRLEDLLENHQYGKIYLMLGINELGYSYDKVVEQYRSVTEKIRSLQPDAILYLEANLHISRKKSDSSADYSNEKLEKLNQAISQMADEKTSFYLDVNPLFDDEEGYLNEEYTGDGAHVKAVYYAQWVQWLLTKAVRYE